MAPAVCLFSVEMVVIVVISSNRDRSFLPYCKFDFFEAIIVNY